MSQSFTLSYTSHLFVIIFLCQFSTYDIIVFSVQYYKILFLLQSM